MRVLGSIDTTNTGGRVLGKDPSPSFNPAPSLSQSIWSGIADTSQTNPYQGAIGAAKGAGSTLFNISSLGNKILSSTVGKGVEAVTGRSQPSAPQKPSFLTPTTAGQQLGYGTEQLGEWFIPAGKIAKVEKVADAGVQGLKIAEQYGGIGKVLENILQLGTRSGIEATAAGLQTATQGGSEEDIKKNALIAGAFPIAGKGLSIIKNTVLPKAASIATGVPLETLQRAYQHPQGMEEALTHVNENPTNPFFKLANTIASKIGEVKNTVEQGYVAAKDAFKQEFPKARFDLNPLYEKFFNPLKDFNLNLEQVGTKNLAGVGTTATELPQKFGTTYKVTVNPQSPFTTKEIGLFNGLLDKIQASRNIGIDDLLDLRRSFARAYDAVPLGINGKPTPYHAAVMALKENAEKIIQDILPAQMKNANLAYSTFQDLAGKMGSKFVDASGEIKQGSESFLSNLLNMNKGAQQTEIAKLEELTGIPIKDNVLLLKDAQRLNDLFPRTGSRTQDILRSLAVGGLGLGAGLGPIGGALGLAASSPKVAGKIATTVGKVSEALPESSGVIKSISERLFGAKPSAEEKAVAEAMAQGLQSGNETVKKYLQENASLGLSVKDVSKLHPEDSKVLTKYIDAIRLKGSPEAPPMSEADWKGAESILQGAGANFNSLSENKLADFAQELLMGKRDASMLYDTFNRDSVGRFAAKDEVKIPITIKKK